MTRRIRVLIIAIVIVIVVGTGAVMMWTSDTPAETPADAGEPVVSITVAPITTATFTETVVGWGQVEPEQAIAGRPPASAQVASPVSGLLAAVLGSEGQRVERGATLFRLDSRVSDVGVERAREALQFAEQRLARQEQLGPGEATSRQAYEEARQQVQVARSALALAERERSLLTISAPLSGTIVRLNARPGDAVTTTQVLAEIIDLQRLVVSAAVRSADVVRVRTGHVVDLVATAEKSDQNVAPIASSTVTFIGNQVDSASDTVVVRARVPAAAGLRPGQFVTMSIHVDTRTDRLAVPVDSIVPGPNGDSIAIVNGDVAEKRKVTTRLRSGNVREVEGEGLRKGLLVAVDGAYDLADRTRVRVRTSASPAPR